MNAMDITKKIIISMHPFVTSWFVTTVIIIIVMLAAHFDSLGLRDQATFCLPHKAVYSTWLEYQILIQTAHYW